MKEYIDKSEIEYPYMTMTLWGLNQNTCKAYNEGVKAAADAIAAIPAADVVERKRGEWINRTKNINGMWDYRYDCSVCGEIFWSGGIETFNFCPNCGADMREVDHAD